MLELILMAVFCGKLREVLGAKHRSALGCQIALIGLWLFVQPFWFALLCVGLNILGDADGKLVLFAYGASVLGGVVSSLIVFLVAAAVPAGRPPV